MITLADIKAALGITTTTPEEDSYLQAQLTVVVALMQRYTHRQLFKAAYSETHLEPGHSVNLKEWPVESVASVSLDGQSLSNYLLIPDKGILRPYGSCCACAGVWTGCKLEVSYIGGFDPLPPDLLLVVHSFMAEAWKRKPTAGIVAGGGDELGQINKMTVFEVGSVEFDTGRLPGPYSSPRLFGAGGAVGDALGGLLGQYLSILDLYVDHAAVIG
jgi:hypothetical protein